MPLPSTVDAAARRREIALWQGAGASAVAKAVSAACQLAQVPVAIAYLGTELFGLWMTLVGALAMMAFADLGIGAGVQNEAAALVGKDRADDAQKTCVNGLAILGLAGAGLAAVLSAGCVWLPWARWIGVVDTAIVVEARQGLLVLIILFCANLPLTALARLAYGLQLGWLANAWYAAINILTLGAVLAASGCRIGFAGFVAMAAVPPVAGHVALGIHLFRKMGWRISSLPNPDAMGMRRLFRAGLPFTLPQLGALALNAMPPVLISATLGPVMVTPWNMGQRLLGLFGQVQAMLLAPLWPAFAEARSRRDYTWLRSNYRRSVILSGIVIALPQLLFVLWGGAAIQLWSHGAVSLNLMTAAAFGFSAAVSSMSQPPAFLLNSFGRAFGQGIYGGLSVAIVVLVAPFVLREKGIGGLAMTAGVVFLAINLPCVYREAGNVLRRACFGDEEMIASRRNRTVAMMCRLIRVFRGKRGTRTVRVVVYKVDRLGDFVLATEALRFVVNSAGKDSVLLVLSEGVRELAEREFPGVEKRYVRFAGGGRAAIRTAWSDPLARGTIRAETLICLRHQNDLFRNQLVTGFRAKSSVGCDEPPATVRSSFSRAVPYPSVCENELPAELCAHAAVLSVWCGERVPPARMIPVLSPRGELEDFVLICPFGSSDVRNYTAERWRETVRALKAMGRKIVLNGPETDGRKLMELAAFCGVESVEVTDDFSSYFALIGKAALVITVETATAHLAAALDKPLVVLMGGGHFGKCAPWKRSAKQVWLTHRMNCFGCNWSCVHEEPWCVRRIEAATVVMAVAGLPSAEQAV